MATNLAGIVDEFDIGEFDEAPSPELTPEKKLVPTTFRYALLDRQILLFGYAAKVKRRARWAYKWNALFGIG